ncbi:MULTISPECIES: DUF1192 domain-containing protein [unclassified Methylobacterium]|jgi:uncharacterized small protein (DUF1192 family)|uniref:DUF1192 domain-containing protein n=1 Tax=unclassified Methylobacterium TaxID=2615210 RepID=UPI001A974343|nr:MULTISPECIES: DUF1192 domain-containing protein [unclassified Methylobacterium]MBO1021517.1 DUF1192 domain-containing protein [Methylobacterium sp. SD274]
MRDDDTDRPKRTVSHTIGESLDTLSLDEIAERIALLRAEIERLESARTGKKSALDRASSIFKL